MQASYTVNNIDSAFDVIIASIENNDAEFVLNFEEIFDIKIKLEGEQWDGKIDYKVGNFIVELQKQIVKIHNSFSKERINISSLHGNKKDLIVTVSIEKGCTEIIAHLKDVLQHISDFGKSMESKHKLMAVVAVALIAGGSYTATEFLREATKKTEKIEEEKTKREFTKIAEESLNVAKVSMGHMEYLARQMKSKDTLTLSGKKYSKPEAIEAFRQPVVDKKEVTYTTYIIDDRYEVALVSFENNHVKLNIKSKSFKATTEFLPEDQKEILYKLYKDADIAQTIPSVDLQIAAQIHDGEIKSAAIVGIGERRTRAVSLFHALAETLEKSRKQGLQQLSLPIGPDVYDAPAPQGQSGSTTEEDDAKE